VKNSKFADCRGGFYPASTGIRDAGEGHQLVENCLFIGESLNVGPPTGVAWEQAAMRSLPQQVRGQDFEPIHDLEWDVLCGIEVYDGFVEIKDCRFAEFEDDNWGTEGERLAAGLTQVAKYSTWSVDPRNSVEDLQFGDHVDHNAYFRVADTGENQISFTTIVDKDGSLGFSQGQPARLYPNENFLMEATTAAAQPDSNLNGFKEPLGGASWGQIVFAPIKVPAFNPWEEPEIEIVRIDDPGGNPSTSPYPYSSITVPLSAIDGGNGLPKYPINLPVQQVADVLGANTEKRYYKISYEVADYGATPPKDI
jgi:hypothetical protein